MRYRYHHMGIPTDEIKEGEIVNEEQKFTSTPFLDNEYRIQWHRFLKGCELPEVLKQQPHVALQVDDLDQEIVGKEVILGPYEFIPGFRVAIINFQGVPIEFVETQFTDEELYKRTHAKKKNA
jgi:hypothetical protein